MMKRTALALMIGVGVLFFAQTGNASPADSEMVAQAGGEMAAFSSAMTRIDSATGIEFVWADGGCFDMITPQGEDGEKQNLRVCLDGFWVGKYEVTQAQWRKVMEGNPSHFAGDDHPVENVSWFDVQEFVSRLNQQSDQAYRLPSEAEWEFAARGGVKSNNYQFAGSDNGNEVAYSAQNSAGSTAAVGSKKANELGVYDMSGNVWEWCANAAGQVAAPQQASYNPAEVARDLPRVIRGGSWSLVDHYARTSARYLYKPDYRVISLGFRLILPGNEGNRPGNENRMASR